MLHLTSIHRRYTRTRGPEYPATTERLRLEIMAEKACENTRNRQAERKAIPLAERMAP